MSESPEMWLNISLTNWPSGAGFGINDAAFAIVLANPGAFDFGSRIFPFVEAYLRE